MCSVVAFIFYMQNYDYKTCSLLTFWNYGLFQDEVSYRDGKLVSSFWDILNLMC